MKVPTLPSYYGMLLEFTNHNLVDWAEIWFGGIDWNFKNLSFGLYNCVVFESVHCKHQKREEKQCQVHS